MLYYKKLKYGFSLLKHELSNKSDYWHLREKAVTREFLSPDIYYLDMKGKGFYPGETKNGIPVFYWNGIYPCFVPITVLNYGLGLLNRLHDGEDVKKNILDVLSFILEQQTPEGVWPLNLPQGVRHEMENGKASGMTQGLAISFLIRCHRIGLLDRNTCLNAVCLAKEVMLSSLCTGMIDGEPFIEEFNVPGKSILNGSIFALWGLFDYEDFTGEYNTFSHFETALQRLLPRFNFGNWSYYDMHGSFCSKFYHQLHVDMMTVLYQMTGNPIYLQYKNHWEKGLKFAFFFIMLKAIQKLFQIRKWSMNAEQKN